MITLTPENYRVSRGLDFTLLGLRTRHRKKAERMIPGDRILYYVLEERTLPATATVSSPYFEDHRPVWGGGGNRNDPFPFRVHTRPNVVLDPWEGLDASALAPRLLYVKRWPPEQWYLAFHGDIHLLSAQDFQLIEREMRRVVECRAQRRKWAPRSVGDTAAAPLLGGQASSGVRQS